MPDHPPQAQDAAAVWVPLSALKPWADNPRRNEAAVDKVSASIRRFGFASPIVARAENGEIIAGHTRAAAAERLKLDLVPVRYLSGLSDAEAHALAIADNRVAEEADWDAHLLAEQMRELQAAGEVALTDLGFDADEVADLLAPDLPVEVQTVETGDVHDEFWISIRGPLPQQPAALELLRQALCDLPEVTCALGTIER